MREGFVRRDWGTGIGVVCCTPWLIVDDAGVVGVAGVCMCVNATDALPVRRLARFCMGIGC